MIPELHTVLGAAWYQASDVSPLVAELALKPHDRVVFGLSEGRLEQRWVKVVRPTLSALLGCAAGHLVSHLPPVLEALEHDGFQHLVLLIGPFTFNQVWTQHFLPSLNTLHYNQCTKE